MNSKAPVAGRVLDGPAILLAPRPELATAQHLTDEATEVFRAFEVVGVGDRAANTAARHAASGFLAHQMCSVEICP